MKKLCLLITSLCLILPSSNCFANETESQILINKLVLHSGPSDFISFIKEVQAKSELNMANPFAPKYELSQENSYYWVYFQPSEYLSELKQQLFDSFTSRELSQILKFYKNPYHSKYLLHFNTKARLSNIHKKITKLKLDELKVDKDKEILTKNLITMHSLNSLIKSESNLLQKELDRIDQIYSVVKLSNNTELERQRKNTVRYLNNFENIINNYMIDSFEMFRKNEMRYMVAQMKDKPLIQKFASIILTYHYFYLIKYDEIYKAKENMKQKLEEKENYKF